ncbi:alpha/beta hydrolase [Parvibaculum sp.]|jgi:pimeloyl-ACP methyl ester carboxylesterase|uniref:alpha/beta fold hydrolase n=1 Tax=Parvibaculum sp. TaxID=2024848 RepID=UPI003297705F
MDFFEADDGVEIGYAVEGEGSPVLLAHGFASTHEVNWIATGWAKALTQAGYRVIMPDMRGHGQSGKPHDKQAYTLSAMAADLVALLDHLGEPGADLMGYSMGAMVSLVAAMERPERFDKIVAAGVGAKLLDPRRDPGPVIEALLTNDPSSIEDKGALLFRTFADQNKQDREALAACFEAVRAPFPADGLSRITRPVLVVAGETDSQAGAAEPLAERMPNGEAFTVPKRDHMKTVGDKAYKEAVLKFLGE